jgi:hypothetical protein
MWLWGRFIPVFGLSRSQKPERTERPSAQLELPLSQKEEDGDKQ